MRRSSAIYRPHKHRHGHDLYSKWVDPETGLTRHPDYAQCCCKRWMWWGLGADGIGYHQLKWWQWRRRRELKRAGIR